MPTASTNSVFSAYLNIQKLGHGAEVRACYPYYALKDNAWQIAKLITHEYLLSISKFTVL